MTWQPHPRYGYCDGCGKDRPTYRRGPEGLGWCFLCVKEDERAAQRAELVDPERTGDR